MDVRMQIEIQKILEYRDIFPNEALLDIDCILKKYNRDLLIRIVNALGMNYGNAYMPDTTLFSEKSALRVRELNERINKYAPNLIDTRVCYCTQRTILELLRHILSIPVEKYKNNYDEKDLEYDIFRIVLQLNENLMRFSNGIGDKCVPEYLYFLSYVLNDVIDAEWKETTRTQLFYFFCLKEFLEKKDNRQLYDRLCDRLGVTTLKEYWCTIFGLICLYVNQQKADGNSCPYLDLKNQKLLSKDLCDYLSLDINGTYLYDTDDVNNRDNNIDYRVFRSHPLITSNNGQYILYNLPLLCERLYNGLFFDIKSVYGGIFFNFYNSKFVEQQLFQNIMTECVGDKTTVYYPKKEDIGGAEIEGQPDFYIREQNSVILFECKGIKLNGCLKDESDISRIVDELRNKLFMSSIDIDKQRTKKKKENAVGVAQLINQIELVKNGRFPLDEMIPSDVLYYPILVIEDPKIVRLGLTSMVNIWYQQLLKEHLVGIRLNPIIVMSINTLFLYKDVFCESGFAIVFNDFLKDNFEYNNDGISWTANPTADFNSYMKGKYRISDSASNYVKEHVNTILKEFESFK